MLTGLAAREHGVDQAAARLPAGLTTVADAARQAGLATALFTANPTTGNAFGFDRGWSTFESQWPTQAGPSVQIFDRAAAWLAQHGSERFLLVVHARGGHPPWDITPDELKALEPKGYTGTLDPRHAGELLSHPGAHGLTEDDRVRAWEMYDAAIAAHDAALGRLISAVSSTGRAGDTAIIVTGDVGVEGSSPLADAGSLDETDLWTPLIVDLPGGEFAGVRTGTPTSGLDLPRTMLGLLGLEPPDSFGGVDLVDLAAHRAPTIARPLVASFGDRFALRWGSFVEAGQRDREGRLCDLSLEPNCISDVRTTYPLAASLLHAKAFDFFVSTKAHPPAREPANIDKETHEALRVWGR
jgi:arylsulfatase A-like enzyme